MKVFRRVALVLLSVVVLGAAGFVTWASIPLGPAPEALSAMLPNATVEVSTNDIIVFRPTASQPATGLIIYPGARVEPRSYAVVARAIAAQGFLVVIVPMPLSLALLGTERALSVTQAFPAVQQWAIGGHSLGGVGAASFAKAHPDLIKALALWASYPQAKDSLAQTQLPVLEIDGSLDGVLNRDQLSTALQNYLPPTTTHITIQGGNHAQFGAYGAQSGDAAATISAEEQQRQIVAATVTLLRTMQSAAQP